MGVSRSAKLSPSLRLPKQRQQVAAVCYRVRGTGIEFLLVQTRGGRWIFPKGGVEPRLTYAQSAAREAFEEAGVHGRIEEVPFARYYRRRPKLATVSRSSELELELKPEQELAVAAYLCEVLHLEPPQESNRNPRWFSVDKVKQRLREDRTPEFGSELSRVVERATSRIERLHAARQTSERTSEHRHADGLRKVRFEAREYARLQDDPRKAVVIGYFLRRSIVHSASAIEAVWQAPGEGSQPVLRLGAGTNAATDKARNVTAIDSGRKSKLTPSSSVSRRRLQKS
jgi:8-oxo-dGTP pyrophosphatase MutT (NUDIX family)